MKMKNKILMKGIMRILVNTEKYYIFLNENIEFCKDVCFFPIFYGSNRISIKIPLALTLGT